MVAVEMAGIPIMAAARWSASAMLFCLGRAGGSEEILQVRKRDLRQRLSLSRIHVGAPQVEIEEAHKTFWRQLHRQPRGGLAKILRWHITSRSISRSSPGLHQCAREQVAQALRMLSLAALKAGFKRGLECALTPNYNKSTIDNQLRALIYSAPMPLYASSDMSTLDNLTLATQRQGLGGGRIWGGTRQLVSAASRGVAAAVSRQR